MNKKSCPPASGRADDKIFLWGIKMKAQIKFQKILTMVSLIVAALTFVYALIFFSGNLSNLMTYYGKEWDDLYTGADGFLDPAQTFVSIYIILAIIFIIAVVTLFITQSNSRRNYYITNYISIGFTIFMAAVMAIVGIVGVSVLMGLFYSIDFEELEEFIIDFGRSDLKSVSQSPLMFIIGYVVSLIALADGLAWAYNLVWKIKLMKGEKALLENGLVKEVA
jgi:hypothetical protein